MLMGTEAALSLLDVAGASTDEALAASSWAAQALVRQALAEASEQSGKRQGRSVMTKKVRQSPETTNE
jgi:hypothetical protein